MRCMRKFETQDIAPKCERTFEIRNGDPGVIGGDNFECCAHAHLSAEAFGEGGCSCSLFRNKRPTPNPPSQATARQALNVQRRILKKGRDLIRSFQTSVTKVEKISRNNEPFSKSLLR